jgi:UDP-GlcNAc:undecaprenyl-phosphate GlcNAc-1-phosphate transferase
VIEDLPEPIRYAAAFIGPFLATLLLTPVAALVARRFDVMDRPGGHKTHHDAIPYLGGLAVAAGVMGVGVLVGGTNGALLTVLSGALVLGAVGLMDDVRSLSPVVRLALEGTAGMALWLVGIQAGGFPVAWLDLPLTLLWVVAVVNAFNMIDNTDGLAAGVAAASALGIAAIAAVQGDYLEASFAFAVAGASLGFLRWNFPPASIFLGDAGSMLLGFLIAALTLSLDVTVTSTPARLLMLVLLVAVPLFDLSLVVIARLAGRRTVWLGGTDHSSHRLAFKGHGRPRIALTFVLVQAVCSLAALVVYEASPAVVASVAALGATTWLVALVVLLRLPHPAPAGAPAPAARHGSGRGPRWIHPPVVDRSTPEQQRSRPRRDGIEVERG